MSIIFNDDLLYIDDFFRRIKLLFFTFNIIKFQEFFSPPLHIMLSHLSYTMLKKKIFLLSRNRVLEEVDIIAYVSLTWAKK